MTATHTFDSFAKSGGSPAADGALRRSSIPSWLKLIQEAVESSDFGTIQIKVHGGEVVQIETTRKIRVSSQSTRNPSHPTAPAEVNS
jgi:hypothetical protein